MMLTRAHHEYAMWLVALKNPAYVDQREYCSSSESHASVLSPGHSLSDKLYISKNSKHICFIVAYSVWTKGPVTSMAISLFWKIEMTDPQRT